MGTLAEADTRETPEDVANAKAEIHPLAGRYLRALKTAERLGAPHRSSPLGRLDELTTPFNTSELVVSNLQVAIDNLRMFFRYLRKTNELPVLAHYSLIRAAIEATSFGLWVLAGKQQAGASRTLRIVRKDQENGRRLFAALGIKGWDTDQMLDLVHERHHALSGIEQSDLNKLVQATNTITAVERQFEHRSRFTGLQVWRATSGLTHSSPSAMVALLERSPDGIRTSRMALSVAFSETAIENVEALLERIELLSREPVRLNRETSSMARAPGSARA